MSTTWINENSSYFSSFEAAVSAYERTGHCIVSSQHIDPRDFTLHNVPLDTGTRAIRILVNKTSCMPFVDYYFSYPDHFEQHVAEWVRENSV